MYLNLNFNKIFARLYVESVTVICHGLPYRPQSVVEKYDALAKYFAKKGLNTLIFDFTGTGNSEGKFRLLNWIEDLSNIVKNFERVNLVGFSMGGVISTYVAANSVNVQSLTVVSTPCCAKIFGDKILKTIYTHATKEGVLRSIGSYKDFVNNFRSDMEKYEPVKWIDKVDVPILIVHGTADELINYESAEILFRKAKGLKELFRVENGNHFLRHDKKVLDKIVSWIQKIN